MVGVWMVLMSHNEPLHNHNTHHVCLPAFPSVLAFHSHPHHINSVHVMVSPMVCTAIQPMACAIHLSLQHNHTLALASYTTGTHHVGRVITVNAKHPHTAKVKVIQQMHALKDKAEVHSVLGVAGLHGDFMKDNRALTKCLKRLVEQGNSVHME